MGKKNKITNEIELKQIRQGRSGWRNHAMEMNKLNSGLVYTNEECIGCNHCISACPVLEANCSLAENGKDLCIYHAWNYKEIKGDPLCDPNRHTMRMEIEWKNEKPIFDFGNNIQ